VARVLLLLPSATYKAPDFLAAARRLDTEVVIATETAQTLAEAMGDRALHVDLDDPEAAASTIVEAAGRRAIDAIVAVDDGGTMTAALAAARLGLAHNPPGAVAVTRNKVAMRDAFARAGVRQPDFRVVGPGADAAALAAELGLPCVVKPATLAASRGVIRADNAAAAGAAASRIREILADAHGDSGPAEPLLVERYIPGEEVAVEGLLRGGDLEILAIFDKPDPLTGPYFEETLYITPSRLPAEVQAALTALVGAAAEALGLREGPIHAEARIAPDGTPWMLELAARTIGGLCGRTLRFGNGATLEEIVLRHALGLPLDPQREGAAAGVMMLPIARRGTLQSVQGQDAARAVPGVEGLEISIAPGRPVVPLPEGDRYLGFLFARGATPVEVEAILRRAHALLQVEIEPD
jgi:biotin carboxylase